MKTSGFSLIELMVVIAIVAVLAAVAVPVYQQYLITSRMAKAGSVVEGLMEQAIIVGTFPPGAFPQSYCYNGYPDCSNALDLGQSNTYYSNDAIVANIIPYFLPSSSGGGMIISDEGTCGKGIFGVISASLDAVKLGFNTSVATNPNVYIQCFFWVNNGTISKVCDYAYGTSSVSGTGNILPGWINANATSGWDNNNENAAVHDNPTLLAVNSC